MFGGHEGVFMFRLPWLEQTKKRLQKQAWYGSMSQ